MANSIWDVGSNVDQTDQTSNDALAAAKNLVSGKPYDQGAMMAQTQQSMQPAMGSLIIEGDPEVVAGNILARAKAAFSRGEISKEDAQAAMDAYKAAKQPNLGSVSNDIRQSNVLTDTQGVQTPVVNGKPNFGKVTVLDDTTPAQNAQNMGFDTNKTYYHGTISPVESFSNEYSDPDNWYGKGTYLTSEPASASEYATKRYDETSNYPGGNVIPAHVSVKNTLDLDKPINNPEFSKDLMNKLQETGDAATVASRAKKFPQIPLEQHAMQYMPAEDVTAVAQKHGYDSIKKGDILNVFDPKNIRSKFAKFDPRKAGSANLSYADGGAIDQLGSTFEEDNLNAYADGGDVEPDGYAQFLAGSSNNAQPQSVSSEPDGAPAGFNEFIAPEVQQSQYGTGVEQAKAGLEGIAQGVAGPLATQAELSAGVNPEAMRQREEANPYTSMAGKIAGLGGSMMAGVGEGRLALGLGEAAGNMVRGAGLASKIGAAAADGAIQNMLVSGGDEITKSLRADPDTSMQSAVTNIGLSGLLGGSVSGALGSVSPLWKAAFGNKGDQVISDFNARMGQHISGYDPTSSVTKELGDHWDATNAIADPVYGANGLKSRQIEKAMPEFHQGMVDQANALTTQLEDSVNTMNAKPNKFPPRLADKMNDVVTDLKSSLANSEQPSDIFNALQDAKQTLQSYGKFDKFVTPVDEGHDFVQAAKKLQFEFRNALEDQKTWGAAGKAQQDINKAFSEYLPATKDFQSKFTTKVSGDQMVDPGKVNTYMNQLGKPNAEIKSKMLQNYIDASDKYRSKISDIYNNLGIDNPVQPTALNATMQTFNKPSTGAQLADVLVEKGLQSAGGKGVGAGLGAMIGSKSGIPGGELLGGMVGAHVLGPFISSVMPLIAKPLMNNAANSVGLKAAADAGQAMIRGQGLVSRAAANLFKASEDVIPSSMAPSAAKLAKLDKLIQYTAANPSDSNEGLSNIAHYMPNHGSAASNIAGKAVSYLGTLRPNTEKKAPLDSVHVPNSTAMANYNRQLANAEQPLMILNRLKNGTLTSKDLMTVQTIYPDLYKTLAIKIMDSMTDHLNKGNVIPYNVKIGLSKFAAQPLDSTMMPNSIMAAQPQPQAPQPPGEQPGKGKPRKGAGGTALNKLSGSYQTATQSLAARHQGEQD